VSNTAPKKNRRRSKARATKSKQKTSRRVSKTAPLQAGYHHDFPMARYLADPCPEASVSSGIVQALVDRSPLHARQIHPRLGGAGDSATARGDLGSAVHARILGGSEIVYAPVSLADWRTDAARTFRDKSRAAGKLPLLASQRDVVEAAAAAALKRLQSFGPGRSEVTMTWQEGNVWCRARADWLPDDAPFDFDVKTTGSAAPRSWISTTLIRGKAMFQAALRARGHTALTGRTRDVVFLLVEIEPPFAVSLVGMEPALADYADRQVQMACKTWGRCLSSGRWPAYRDEIHYAELPGWLGYADDLQEVA